METVVCKELACSQPSRLVIRSGHSTFIRLCMPFDSTGLPTPHSLRQTQISPQWLHSYQWSESERRDAHFDMLIVSMTTTHDVALRLWELGISVQDLLVCIQSSKPLGDVLVWRNVDLAKAGDVDPWVEGKVGNGRSVERDPLRSTSCLALQLLVEDLVEAVSFALESGEDALPCLFAVCALPVVVGKVLPSACCGTYESAHRPIEAS